MSRVIHFEIHAENPERAIEFYQSGFGWQFQKWDSPVEYWMIKTGPDSEPGINGGLIRRRGELDGKAITAYVCTIDVKDLDKTISTVEKNGGAVVHEKITIPGVGWLIFFKDTEGNIFGAMQADKNAA